MMNKGLLILICLIGLLYQPLCFSSFGNSSNQNQNKPVAIGSTQVKPVKDNQYIPQALQSTLTQSTPTQPISRVKAGPLKCADNETITAANVTKGYYWDPNINDWVQTSKALHGATEYQVTSYQCSKVENKWDRAPKSQPKP